MKEKILKMFRSKASWTALIFPDLHIADQKALIYSILGSYLIQTLREKRLVDFNFCFYTKHLSVRIYGTAKGKNAVIDNLKKLGHIFYSQLYDEQDDRRLAYAVASKAALAIWESYCKIPEKMRRSPEFRGTMLHGLFNNLDCSTLDEYLWATSLDFLKYRKLHQFESRYELE